MKERYLYTVTDRGQVIEQYEGETLNDALKNSGFTIYFSFYKSAVLRDTGGLFYGVTWENRGEAKQCSCYGDPHPYGHGCV